MKRSFSVGCLDITVGWIRGLAQDFVDLSWMFRLAVTVGARGKASVSIWLSWGRWGLAERRIVLFWDDNVCTCETSTSFWYCMPSSTTDICLCGCWGNIVICWGIPVSLSGKNKVVFLKAGKLRNKTLIFYTDKRLWCGCSLFKMVNRRRWSGIILIITTGSSYKAHDIFTSLSKGWMTSGIWNKC